MGDKVEIVCCVVVSFKFVVCGQYIYIIVKFKCKDNVQDYFDFLCSKMDVCFFIDGESLMLFFMYFCFDFIFIVVKFLIVVVCCCLLNQKVEVVKFIKEYIKKWVCCIGDGGNDVFMIQVVDVGVGIVGKEGCQVSFVVDFLIEQFYYFVKLLVWYGCNSYKCSVKFV